MLKHIITAVVACAAASLVMPAQTVQSISSMRIVEDKTPKERKEAREYLYIDAIGGITILPDHGDVAPTFGATVGYKRQLGESNFLVGAELTGLFDTLEESGPAIDVAPTISYMRHPGRFYDSFEASFGLGLGYRAHPAGGFAVTPELNFMYWFNHFGIGATARFSLQKDDERTTSTQGYDFITNTYYPTSHTISDGGKHTFIGVRLSYRFGF